MTKHVGILTAGGDSPGLNAAIRGVGKCAQSQYGMQVIGFRDGFKGLVVTTHSGDDKLPVIPAWKPETRGHGWSLQYPCCLPWHWIPANPWPE